MPAERRQSNGQGRPSECRCILANCFSAGASGFRYPSGHLRLDRRDLSTLEVAPSMPRLTIRGRRPAGQGSLRLRQRDDNHRANPEHEQPRGLNSANAPCAAAIFSDLPTDCRRAVGLTKLHEVSQVLETCHALRTYQSASILLPPPSRRAAFDTSGHSSE